MLPLLVGAPSPALALACTASHGLMASRMSSTRAPACSCLRSTRDTHTTQQQPDNTKGQSWGMIATMGLCHVCTQALQHQQVAVWEHAAPLLAGVTRCVAASAPSLLAVDRGFA